MRKSSILEEQIQKQLYTVNNDITIKTNKNEKIHGPDKRTGCTSQSGNF